MQVPGLSQAAQQGSSQVQHHTALSQPAHAPDSAAVATTAHDSAPPVTAESAPPVAAEAPAPVAAESAPPVAAGPFLLGLLTCLLAQQLGQLLVVAQKSKPGRVQATPPLWTPCLTPLWQKVGCSCQRHF